MTSTHPTDFDVLIIGAGISGIGAAHHLKTKRPTTSFAVLDGRDEIGGTWSLFRYPGIRSDSDMPSFGFGFKPWTHKLAIADAHIILDYLREAVAESNLDQHFRFGRKVVSANFSSAEARWTVRFRDTHTGEFGEMTSRFLYVGTGYYNYDEGYSPEFVGSEDFGGTIIHPQHWPADFDYSGKRVVVIGSGATAVTLIPAMAKSAGHVTMLQRSPSYVLSLPAADAIANTLNRVIGPDRAYSVIRRKNIFMNRSIYKLCQRFPKAMRRLLMADVRRRLPRDFDVDTHFGPKYNPWDQRLCMVPNGDLFKTISSGKASVATDHIERFTENGIQLTSGRHLDADVIVTATGLNLLAFGGIDLSVDSVPVDLSSSTVYKSMMVSGVPNLVFAIGYTNIAWTLKVDLVSEHFCRLLDHMDEHGQTIATPILADPTMERLPLLDLSSGYVQRAIANFPKAGTHGSWTAAMAYEDDAARLLHGAVADPDLHFTHAEVAAVA
jgi:cation diffusion facilitator CzcD-associated flavoprotein CzcO